MFNQALANGLARGLPLQTALASALNAAVPDKTVRVAHDASALSTFVGGGAIAIRAAGPQSPPAVSDVAMVNALARGESPQQAQARAERVQAAQSMAEQASRADATDPMRVLSNGHQAPLIQSVGQAGGSALAAALARGESMAQALEAATHAQEIDRKTQIAAQIDKTDPLRAMSNGNFGTDTHTATSNEREVMSRVLMSGQNPANAIQITSKMVEIEKRFAQGIERGMTPSKQLAGGALPTNSLMAPALDQAFARGLTPAAIPGSLISPC